MDLWGAGRLGIFAESILHHAPHVLYLPPYRHRAEVARRMDIMDTQTFLPPPLSPREAYIATNFARVAKIAAKCAAVPCVPDAVIPILIDCCTSKRAPYRWLSRPAKLSPQQVDAVRVAWPAVASRPVYVVQDLARTLKSMAIWHGSGGSLWGPMGWRINLGAEVYDRMDTLAQFMRAAGGRPISPALERWDRALGAREVL